MDQNHISPSILFSIFKRQGGEGNLTKIINEENRADYFDQLLYLEQDESAIICYRKDEMNWLLLTTRRIINKFGKSDIIIPYLELAHVGIAIQEEFKDNIKNKDEFSRIEVKDINGKKTILQLERGKPFQGIYQILHHLKNKTFSQNKKII